MLDLNDHNSLQELFNYFKINNLTKHLNELHVKIKTSEYLNISQYIAENNLDFINSDEQQQQQLNNDFESLSSNIKIKVCRPYLHTKNRNSKRNVFHPKTNDFYDMITSGENVVTFFNSKLNQQTSQYISILFTNETKKNKYYEYVMDYHDKNNYQYCIELKNYEKKLPFVCKYEGKYSNKSKKYQLVDFFPDSLYNYQQDPKMSYVINSLLAVVHGLNRIHKRVK